ncbi:hypothetical protein CROQUDRAFT_571387 [Cronartium quercuum f. sp. fusiforme G11]|uniref:PWWP domain-containing protein n=1 Tax=Cronartium quercuum f. sp. fusiforme G11 TaxID=708437 RepID=A0A9P6TGN0_9BASI|nr:hypothetical protein CROQUDRAFT_571387 [Cronartium quercuum f. sp. fusiforme G11]
MFRRTQLFIHAPLWNRSKKDVVSTPRSSSECSHRRSNNLPHQAHFYTIKRSQSDNVFVSALLASLPIEWSEFITSWSQSSQVDSTTIIRAIQTERNLRESCTDNTYKPLAMGSTSSASHLFQPNCQDCSLDTTTTTSAFHIKQEQSQDSDSFQFSAPCPSSLNTTITHEPMSFRSQSIDPPHEEIFASKNNYLINRSNIKSPFTKSKDSLLSSQSSFAKHRASHESVEPMTRLIEKSDTKVSPKLKSELPIFSGTIDASKKYSIGDMVLAKVNGWPAWPARVMEYSRAPDDLHLKGRRAANNTYLLRFFETAN